MSTPQIRLPLRFRDVDAFGHVYHAEYLTLLDEARTRWFREVVVRSVTVRRDLAAGRSRTLTDAERDRLERS